MFEIDIEYYFFIDYEMNGKWPEKEYCRENTNREFRVGEFIELYGRKYKIIEIYHRSPYNRTDLLVKVAD